MEVITLTKNYFRITFIFDAVICSINCSALFENLFSVSAITVIFFVKSGVQNDIASFIWGEKIFVDLP